MHWRFAQIVEKNEEIELASPRAEKKVVSGGF